MSAGGYLGRFWRAEARIGLKLFGLRTDFWGETTQNLVENVRTAGEPPMPFFSGPSCAFTIFAFHPTVQAHCINEQFRPRASWFPVLVTSTSVLFGPPIKQNAAPLSSRGIFSPGTRYRKRTFLRTFSVSFILALIFYIAQCI